jgi:hypothetical protein
VEAACWSWSDAIVPPAPFVWSSSRCVRIQYNLNNPTLKRETSRLSSRHSFTLLTYCSGQQRLLFHLGTARLRTTPAPPETHTNGHKQQRNAANSTSHSSIQFGVAVFVLLWRVICLSNRVQPSIKGPNVQHAVGSHGWTGQHWVV